MAKTDLPVITRSRLVSDLSKLGIAVVGEDSTHVQMEKLPTLTDPVLQ